VGISLVSPCGTRVLLHVFLLVMLGAPTLGGDMVVKSKLEALKSTNCSVIPHSKSLPLNSMFLSLANETMGQFSPSFWLYSGMRK
jgi:hypothetical protein